MSDKLDFKQVGGTLKLVQLSVQPTSAPDAGYVYVYPKIDGRFYQMDSSWTETAIDQDTICYLLETRNLLRLLLCRLVEQGFKIKDQELYTELKQFINQ